MKKKLLPLAMLAGLVGTAGTAEAVFINSDGLGETLIYPFYTVAGDADAGIAQDTYIAVVNTTNFTKAVKVRFLEAMNSAEVLDFNLYLSPHDHWAGVITTTADGAMLKTTDTSCTVPTIPADGVAFRNFEYAGDGGPQGLDRTREGYVEVIEMGVISDDAAVISGVFGAEAAILHGAGGVPAACDTITAAWLGAGVANPAGIVGTGYWTNSAFVPGDPLAVPPVPAFPAGVDSNNFESFNPIAPDLPADAADHVGGLYGYGVLINVTEGTNATYSAVALDSFFNVAPNHTNPGVVSPSLGDANPQAVIIANQLAVTLDYVTNGADGWDAVSALFMHNTISNDYVLEPGILAGTDWVVTMPTKREYVNNIQALDSADPAAVVGGVIPPVTFWDDRQARPPFTRAWVDGRACEGIQPIYWDREEQLPGVLPSTGDVDFSPRPPTVTVVIEGFSLCSEVSVISFYHPEEGDEFADVYESALYPSENIQYGLPTEFNNGWARIDMTTDNSAIPQTRILFSDGVIGGIDNQGTQLLGLPAIGFAVQKYTNGAVSSFYSGLIEHKYTRTILEGAAVLPVPIIIVPPAP